MVTSTRGLRTQSMPSVLAEIRHSQISPATVSLAGTVSPVRVVVAGPTYAAPVSDGFGYDSSFCFQLTSY